MKGKPAITSVSNEQFYEFVMITDKWKKLSRKFGTNQYNDLFSFQFDDNEQFSSLAVSTLNKFSYRHSNSVAVNPKNMEEPTSYQIKSKILDHHCKVSRSSEYFFPSIRNPIRQDLKSLIQTFLLFFQLTISYYDIVIHPISYRLYDISNNFKGRQVTLMSGTIQYQISVRSLLL